MRSAWRDSRSNRLAMAASRWSAASGDSQDAKAAATMLDLDTPYLLRVVVKNMAHYSRFVLDTLLKHPSVQDCKTSFVLDRVKSTTALPL
ncbi:Lrp/AsnC family transcriptional regulator [Stenotrophomonas maltophilia]|nr:Lrp/AsnC family transcriptional regulator [Stenotrophomonas maltophilia]MBA0353143.1 Lrp/AsnC family transcriptional regulator [Stenotrophomonas maltophilia]PSD18540.1 Lrp/AsnC family transcriptional regulator [Stenotrophomonas maltophilia]